MAYIPLATSVPMGVVQDDSGNAQSNVSIYVYATGTDTPIAVYTTAAATTGLGQPLTTDSHGNVPGYAASGQVVDFYDPATGSRKTVQLIAVSDITAVSTALTAEIAARISGDATLASAIAALGDAGGAGPDPEIIVAPVISGVYATGNTLTCSSGSWSNSPTSYAYQWYVGSSPATGTGNSTSSYVVASGDTAHAITCQVTATNTAGYTTVSSNALSLAITNLSATTGELWVTISATVTPNIVNCTLYEGSTQLAPDAQPNASGFVSWSNVTVSSGSQTATVTGYTNPPGLGGDNTSASVTFDPAGSGSILPYPSALSPSSLGETVTLGFDDEFVGPTLLSNVSGTGYGWAIINGAANNNVNSTPSNVAFYSGISGASGNCLGLTLSSESVGAQIVTCGPNGLDWTYSDADGYFFEPGMITEARVWFPGNGGGSYNWPAYWTSGPSWPSNGEFDIAEATAGNVIRPNNIPAAGQSQQQTNNTPGTYWGAWHIFTCYYKSTTDVYYYYDGVLKLTGTNNTGGGAQAITFNVGWQSGAQLATGLSSTVYVDYCRVWTVG